MRSYSVAHGFIADNLQCNPIGNIEAGLLACVLHRTDDFTREPLLSSSVSAVSRATR